MIKKYIQGGKVAVLYSPGYGAGWYSWNKKLPELLFDEDIVRAILSEDLETAERVAKAKYPDVYIGNMQQLKIYWMEPGTIFEVEEYDGSESIHIIGSREYHVA